MLMVLLVCCILISLHVTSSVMSSILAMHRVAPMMLWTNFAPCLSSGGDLSASLAS